jgi:hypothetical protein
MLVQMHYVGFVMTRLNSGISSLGICREIGNDWFVIQESLGKVDMTKNV